MVYHVRRSNRTKHVQVWRHVGFVAVVDRCTVDVHVAIPVSMVKRDGTLGSDDE
ncbi:hypothetical protein LCGC14_2900130 [marine sediment metagenome]|uniref:Uncharacterized protein n=1 Tax=marine sediment metagenome TaxID=412755 RepID=A0A0F9AKS7_9ZZZZ